MTHDELRTYFANKTLPASMMPHPHMVIVDVAKFVDTSLARLDSESPILRARAAESLRWLAEKIENP